MAFLQEDDGAFEAALSFLDEFAPSAAISPDASLPVLDVALDSSANCQQKAKRSGLKTRRKLTEEEKKRRKAEFNEKRRLLRKAGIYANANRARNERSQEVARLREQMEKLKIDLQLLQARHKQRDETTNETGTELNEKNVGSQITSMWQGLADQQRRRRELAERDNVLLRLAVERQTKVAITLQTQMQRRATQLTNECASLVTTAYSSNHAFNVLDFSGDMESFRGLFRRLDNAYQMMDEAFMENGIAGMTVPPVEVHVIERGDGKSLQFVSYKTLPFDVNTTAEVTWEYFKGIEKHLANGSLYEKAEKGLDEPNTIIADFKKETFSSSSRQDIKVKQVIRRYAEDDRDVVIWVSRAVAIEIKHKVLQGLTYYLHGYAVTKRSPESTPSREVSVLQLYYVVTLDNDVDVICNPSKVHQLINFLATTTVLNIQAHRERIENALVDRSLRRIQH